MYIVKYNMKVYERSIFLEKFGVEFYPNENLLYISFSNLLSFNSKIRYIGALIVLDTYIRYRNIALTVLYHPR